MPIAIDSKLKNSAALCWSASWPTWTISSEVFHVFIGKVCKKLWRGNNDGGLEKPFTIFSLKSCWHFYPKIFWYYLRVNYQKHSTNQKYHDAAEWELLATEWILDVEKHCDNLIRSCQALSKHLSNCAEASGGLHAQESPLLRPSSPFRDYSVGSSIRFVLTNLLNRIKYWYNTTI